MRNLGFGLRRKCEFLGCFCAINKTITLNVASFETAEDVTANVAIFAVDTDGAKTGSALVTNATAEIKDDVVVFDVSSKTFGDADYVIEVTVGETTETVNVTVEFDAVETLVADINEANSAQLVGLLDNEDYFTNFNVANVDKYQTKVGSLTTIDEVKKDVIDAVNAAAEVTAGFDKFVEDVEEATTDYARYTLLKNNFQFVNDVNMNEYLVEDVIFDSSKKVALGDAEAVQDAVDKVNLDAVIADGVATINGDAKPSALNAYKTALEALELANADIQSTVGSKTKAQLITAIDTQLEAITTAQEAAVKSVEAANKALVAYEAAKEEFATEEVYTDVVAAIADLQKEDLSEDALATTTLDSAVSDLKEATVAITIVETALADLAAFAEAVGEDAELELVYTNVTDLFTDFEGEDYTFTADKDIDDLKAALIVLNDETAEWTTYNAVIATTTATEMRSLLFKFEEAGYTNLSSAQKLEFAGQFITALADADPAKADYSEVKSLLTSEVGTYTGLIDNVNVAGDIAAMITALEAISGEYAALGGEAKSDIAEAVLGGAPYSTIADIVAAMGL